MRTRNNKDRIRMNKSSQIKEIVKCRKKPTHFVNEYIYFYDSQEHTTLDLNLWDFQEDYVENFYSDRFKLILKSRQLGITTVNLALALHETIFFKNTRILIIAQTEADATNLLDNIKFMYERLPDYMKPVTGKDSAKVLEFPKLNSSIEVKACSPKAGRSIQATHVILDEFAFYSRGSKKGTDEEIYKSIYPTVSRKGRLTIISTPNGMGNKYHELVHKAKQGELSTFKFYNWNWEVRPDRDQQWKEDTIKAIGKKAFEQEYNCSFLQSGSPIFDSAYLKLSTTHKPPIRNHNYMIGADPSEGDINSDYCAAYVIDTDTLEEVAEVRGRYKPDQFAKILDNLGRQYNNALLGVERNNHGHTVLLKLEQLHYPNIYRHTDGKEGWLTSSTTKPIIIDELEEALRHEEIKIASKILLNELHVFQHLGGTKMGAPHGYFDDCVMAFAIAFAMRKKKVSRAYARKPKGW